MSKRRRDEQTAERSCEPFKQGRADRPDRTPPPAQMELAADSTYVRRERGALRLRTIAQFVDEPAPRPRLVIAAIERGLDRRQPIAERARLGRRLCSVLVGRDRGSSGISGR
jgi:hypothetical protein